MKVTRGGVQKKGGCGSISQCTRSARVVKTFGQEESGDRKHFFFLEVWLQRSVNLTCAINGLLLSDDGVLCLLTSMAFV